MLNWIIYDFLLNKGYWLLCSWVLIIIYSIRLYKRNWQGSRGCAFVFVYSFITFFVIIVAFIVFVIASNYLVNNLFQRPSRVDASPISTINENQFHHFDNAISQLVEEGYIHELRIVSEDNHNLPIERQRRVYATVWNSLARFTSTNNSSYLAIGVYIYNCEERATSWLQSTGRLNPQHVHIQNDNNTEVLMLYPWMPVSPGGWHIPSNLRYIRTEIRIGNIVIRFDESRVWGNLRNDYTSQFIAALVEALK